MITWRRSSSRCLQTLFKKISNPLIALMFHLSESPWSQIRRAFPNKMREFPFPLLAIWKGQHRKCWPGSSSQVPWRRSPGLLRMLVEHSLFRSGVIQTMTLPTCAWCWYCHPWGIQGTQSLGWYWQASCCSPCGLKSGLSTRPFSSFNSLKDTFYPFLCKGRHFWQNVLFLTRFHKKNKDGCNKIITSHSLSNILAFSGE